MTDQEQNTLIAKAMSADPDEKRQEWVWVRPFPERYHFIPRDFAMPENTLRLVEWASGQEWAHELIRIDGVFCSVMQRLEVECHFANAPRYDAALHARQVRDIIAAKLKEIAE